MTEFQLYKFINNHAIEWRTQDHKGEKNVLMFVMFRQIEAFYSVLSIDSFYDGVIECEMMDGYFTFWMKDICDYYDIGLENVFRED